MDVLGRSAGRIDFTTAEGETIGFDNLRIAAPGACITLSEARTDLKAGERVLIAGENGEERALFFRAVSGLWPWGGGEVSLPPREAMMFMPARPYVPPGDLRAAATYPHPPDAHDIASIARAFAAVGLERFEPMLKTTERWDRRLTDDEKQCLAFVRVVLHKPRWLVMNDALDELDPASRERIETLLAGELVDIGVINIAHGDVDGDVFPRSLRLLRDEQGPTLDPAFARSRRDSPEAAAAPVSAE